VFCREAKVGMAEEVFILLITYFSADPGVYGRLLAEIVDSNLAEDMDVCLL
jgi:hypothetical protein